MNHCVPDFEMDEDDSILTSSGVTRPKKSSIADEEVMELLWQNHLDKATNHLLRASPQATAKESLRLYESRCT
ncbi:hypothetical protein NMG60_11028224 [Bertholletia excelsa]